MLKKYFTVGIIPRAFCVSIHLKLLSKLPFYKIVLVHALPYHESVNSSWSLAVCCTCCLCLEQTGSCSCRTAVFWSDMCGSSASSFHCDCLWKKGKTEQSHWNMATPNLLSAVFHWVFTCIQGNTHIDYGLQV